MSEWRDITPPGELDSVNRTAVAKALGGVARVRVFWNPETRVIVARLLTVRGAENRRDRGDPPA